MSIEVQSAPKISQIGLDRNDNDLQFCLDESGAITTKKTHSKLENISKHKQPISKDKIQDMASNYSDYYDSYDDDFEEDASPQRSPRKEPGRDRERRGSYLSRDYTRSDISVTPPRRTKRQNDSRRNSLVSYRSAYGQSRATNKSSKKKTKKSQSASTRTVKTEETSNMVQRILSANRNKIMKLYNTVEELQHEVDNLRQENKTLKRLHVKQEKELKQIEKAEASLPQLLQRHSAELRTYRERLKKTKVDMTKKEKESHNNDLEITKLRDKVQHYKSLDDDKKLEERAALTRKLEKVEKSLSEKDKRIMELQKTMTLSEKARQREIKEQQERHKKATEELKKVRENVAYLKEKLKEKEKLLDNTNLYHQSIQKKLKRSNPLALPLAVQPEDLHSIKDFESTASHSDDKKRDNVFITNGPSDTSSVTAENEVIKSSQPGKLFDSEKVKDSELREVLEREERRRKDEENARIREEELRRKQEEEFERMRQMKKKQEEDKKRFEEERKIQEEERKRQEEEQKRREDERRKSEEMMRKKREEEERIRKEKEEQERLKFKEDEETRRKKDLLLARMRAIDVEQNPKPNGIIDIDLGSKSQDAKPKKLPIFLQSSEKPKETTTALGDSRDHEKTKTGSSTSVRSRHSQSSYDFKETIQNLHHGLPAHPSDQHLRSVAAKGQKDSTGDEELVFGSYKPSVGKRETKQLDTFGSYNPSSTETKNTGLDFSRKPNQKISSPPKDNDLVFGSYQPTFGAATGNDASMRKGGRRGRTDLGRTSNTVFGDDLFSNNKSKENQTTSLFSEDSFGKSKDKSYPWEKKVNVSKQSVDENLLPRRQKIQQGLNKGHEQNVPVWRNVLNDTIDDDIEEVTL